MSAAPASGMSAAAPRRTLPAAAQTPRASSVHLLTKAGHQRITVDERTVVRPPGIDASIGRERERALHPLAGATSVAGLVVETAHREHRRLRGREARHRVQIPCLRRRTFALGLVYG